MTTKFFIYLPIFPNHIFIFFISFIFISFFLWFLSLGVTLSLFLYNPSKTKKKKAIKRRRSFYVYIKCRTKLYMSQISCIAFIWRCIIHQNNRDKGWKNYLNWNIFNLLYIIYQTYTIYVNVCMEIFFNLWIKIFYLYIQITNGLFFRYNQSI